MPRSVTTETIVLRAYDVGEADRFCVLFTRDHGRLTARASGARRPVSRLGPQLLPLAHLRLHLKESSKGWIIAGVAPNTSRDPTSVDAFLRCSEGIELLLRLTEDEHPLPEIFDATLTLLSSAPSDPLAPLRYAFHLLDLLGFLPELEEYTVLVRLTSDEIAFVEAVRLGQPAERRLDELSGVRRLKDLLLRDHLSSPLKVPSVAAAMNKEASS